MAAIMSDVGVAMASASDDVMLVSEVSERAAARELAEEKGIAVEAIRAQDVEAMIEREPYKISKRQAEAIDLLLKGFSMTEVARRVGVTKRTVYRWRYNHPQFIAVYARITQELNEQAGRRAEQLVYQALNIVQEAMRPEKKESLRLSAALRVLNSMRVSKLLFTSPGESHFNLALDEIIRKQRLQENLDPNLPIDKYDREDALHLLELQNVTEMADDEGGDIRTQLAEAGRRAKSEGRRAEMGMTNDQIIMTKECTSTDGSSGGDGAENGRAAVEVEGSDVSPRTDDQSMPVQEASGGENAERRGIARSRGESALSQAAGGVDGEEQEVEVERVGDGVGGQTPSTNDRVTSTSEEGGTGCGRGRRMASGPAARLKEEGPNCEG